MSGSKADAAPLPVTMLGDSRRCRMGLIGYGTVGRAVAEAILRLSPRIELAGVLVRKPLPVPTPRRADSIEALIGFGVDVVVECASQDALRVYGVAVLAAGVDLVPSSIGAFAEDAFLDEIAAAAGGRAGRLFIPSGGLAGIDALGSAKHMGLDRVLYRGSAPPHAWVVPAGAEPEADGRIRVFAGTARHACLAFPKNANVAAALSLAGLGFDRTEVELFADPSLDAYRHEIIAEGGFGRFRTEVMGNLIDPRERPSKLIVGSLVQTALKSVASIVI